VSHDDLLNQGPQAAPEPETAEERSARVGKRGLAGGAAAGTAVAAKLGGLKFLLWFFAIRGTFDLLHFGLWAAFAVLLGGLAMALLLRARREE